MHHNLFTIVTICIMFDYSLYIFKSHHHTDFGVLSVNSTLRERGGKSSPLILITDYVIATKST